MLSNTFLEVLKHEGVAAIATQGADVHLINTWNTYIQITDGRNLLIPAGRMHQTEKNISVNKKVLLTLGSREVTGLRGQPGAGFLVRGNADFLSAGPDFEIVKRVYPWARAALKITVENITQTL